MLRAGAQVERDRLGQRLIRGAPGMPQCGRVSVDGVAGFISSRLPAARGSRYLVLGDRGASGEAPGVGGFLAAVALSRTASRRG